MTRRELLQGAGALAAYAALHHLMPAYAQAGTTGSISEGVVPLTAPGDTDIVNLVIAETPFSVNGRNGMATTINGTLPGPIIRLREGRNAVLNVTNRLRETSSIHWHGLLVPPDMDGVPGVSFAGIAPGETFVYKFPIRQSGTYWAHSHSGGQEQLGVYLPLVLDPAETEPLSYSREHVVVLSDWSFDSPENILQNLKKRAGYYNFQRRTAGNFLGDASRNGLGATIKERAAWAKMRMDPTDIADVTGYTYSYLMNGMSAEANWTGLFRAGEKVRLRFVNASAMTYFDVRIPGLEMTLVAADGQPVQPVAVDEFRIAVAETYDMIVEPTEDHAYTLFAETSDRSGFVCGTLAPSAGMSAPVPPRRPRPDRPMADMGMEMSGMSGMNATEDKGAKSGKNDMKGMNMNGAPVAPAMKETSGMPGMSGSGMGAMPGMKGPSLPGSPPLEHGKDSHGVGNSAAPMTIRSRLDEPGTGLGGDNRRVLVYADLKALKSYPDRREPQREIELHITGNMERFMWSFDGKKYSEAKTPIPFRHGERLRLVLVNDTMMEHPIHLHGMWMELENGQGELQPRKHTINVKPAERVTLAITADSPGRWAMHCHLLLHMELGMFRVVEVSPAPTEAA